MTVTELKSKQLPIFEHFHQVLTIPTFVVALRIGPLQISKSHPRCHIIHHVVRIFEVEDMEWLTSSVEASDMSTPPTSLSENFRLTRSPWTLFGQYRRSYERINSHTTFSASETIPFATQKPLSITKYLLVEKIGSYIWSTSPTVIPIYKCNFGPSCDGLSSSPTICSLHKIEVRPQKIVWRSFTKWCGFRPKHMNPGGGLILIPHHALVNNIDPRWVELVRHVFVPFLLHPPHMKESILIMHFPVCIHKWGNDFIKAMARHVFVETKRGSSMHHWRFNLPPVTPVKYPNPTSHVKPTTNPLW